MSALPQRGARVEQVSLEQGVERVTAHAPDLVLLNVGSAQVAAQFAHDLQQQPAGTTTPVIVLCDDDAVATLQVAERSGIVARLDSSASVEDVALALETQLRTQTDALLEQRLPIAASELGDWVALAEKKGVCGLVLAKDALQVMVLGPGGATVPTQQRFRDALVAASGPSLGFLQLPATRVRVLTESAQTPFEGESVNLPEVRVAVIHPDPETRSLWERHMASAGAEVLFDEVEDDALSKLGESAPDLLVVHEYALCSLARAGCWRDVHLQFSSLLVVSAAYANEIHPHDLVAEAAELLSTHVSLQTRIADADLLVERVESLGPARWLREVQGYDGLVELRVHAPQGSARVRIDNGEVHEASYWPRVRHGQKLQGTAALRALLDARFGRLIVGPPQQVADADQRHRLRAAPSLVPQQPSAVARPSKSSKCGSSQGPSPDISPAAARECTASAPAATLEAAVRSSPLAQPVIASASHPTTSALEVPREAGRYGAALRPRAIAVGTLALLAMVGAALGLTAPRPRHPTAMATAPARAAEHSARPAFGPPSPQAVAIPAAAVAPLNEGVADPAADVALSAARPAANVTLSLAEVAANAACSVAEPVAAPLAQTQPQALAPTATAVTSAANASLIRDEASEGVVELPLRLRRWLKPTSVQQRVIDAFLARADKNFARAERLLSEAHELDPADSEVAYQLALTYARQGRLEQTLSWARQARQLSPLDPAPIALEGDIHFLRGQFLESEQAWQQCLRLRPGYPGCVRRLEQLKSRP